MLAVVAGVVVASVMAGAMDNPTVAPVAGVVAAVGAWLVLPSRRAAS